MFSEKSENPENDPDWKCFKAEVKAEKKIPGLKKNQQIVCFAETFALFSQRVHPNHIFFIFWKTQKDIILVGKLTLLKSKNIVFKNHA